MLERDGRLTWLELRGEEGSRNELQARQHPVVLRPGKKAGLCCPLSADRVLKLWETDRDRRGPDDLSAKDSGCGVGNGLQESAITSPGAHPEELSNRERALGRPSDTHIQQQCPQLQRMGATHVSVNG